MSVTDKSYTWCRIHIRLWTPDGWQFREPAHTILIYNINSDVRYGQKSWIYIHAWMCSETILYTCIFAYLHTDYHYVGFKVLMVITAKNMVSWVITPCSSEEVQHFRWKCGFHLEDWRVSYTRDQQRKVLAACIYWCLARLILQLWRWS
jgi:hypothetical protein